MTVRRDVAFDEALEEVLACCAPLPAVDVPVEEAAGLVATRDLRARLDCPAAPVSAMDGYAVAAAELARAGPDAPVRLPVVGADKSWLQRRLGLSSQLPAMNLAGDFLATAEVRAHWARYGL